jgi:Subtilase family
MPDPLMDVPPVVGAAELIVAAHPQAGLRTRGKMLAAVDADVSPLQALLERSGARMTPLFGPSEARVRATSRLFEAAADAEPLPDLGLFYRVEADAERMHDLAQALAEQDAVEAAFVKPPALLASVPLPAAGTDPPAKTPDFTWMQGYLDPAPDGVDARFAWTVPGGSGAGVLMIDVEGNWNFTHEDLVRNPGRIVFGVADTTPTVIDHGTAVMGIVRADRNDFGVTGIAPDTTFFGASTVPLGTAPAILAGANALRPGDILVLELQRYGPAFDFGPPPGTGDVFYQQQGCIPVEWWPDDFAAIRYATARGVIVVSAGGNGTQNLDDPMYDVNPPPPQGPFPAWWRNPFRRSPLDSGSILVGAGAPPPGPLGDFGPNLSRLPWSDFGALMDVQGWGRSVATTGWGTLQNGPDQDRWYTERFAGTSSATPIVAGPLACVQGALRAAGRMPLTPSQARALVRGTGTPQQPGPVAPVTERIGNRPDLRQMIVAVGL